MSHCLPDIRIFYASVVVNTQVLVQHSQQKCLTLASILKVWCWTLEYVNEHLSVDPTLTKICLTLALTLETLRKTLECDLQHSSAKVNSFKVSA